MASWYRKFLKNLASIAEPLTSLTRKGRKYEWTGAQQTAFEAIKALIASAPVLARPNFDAKFVLHTDASDTGIGAVLLQSINGEERVLEFASRTLTPAERNYSVTERECLAVIWAIGKFRPYIEGYHFTVVTDHSSLRWLRSLHSPTGRLARWALELQGHDFEVEHRKGALHHVPDALSRMYEEDEGEAEVAAITWTTDTTDKWYQSRCASVASNPSAYPRWKVVGGRLYYFRPNDVIDAAVGDDEAWKLVVPKENRRDIIQECHDDPTAGHAGREKTFNLVARYYYWPRFYETVQKYVRSCPICQQCKVEQRPPSGLMGKRTVDRPWQIVAADITGPLVKSTRGFEYVLVMEDLFTRWVECVPIRKANAKTILKEFKDKIVLRFGKPEVFLSDNGREFKNKTIDEYLDNIGVVHSTTAPYCPQENPTERVNRTLKTRIVAFIEENHRDWDEKLRELNFSLNNTVHEATGFTPAMLNFGRQPIPPGAEKQRQDRLAAEEEEALGARRWADRLRGMEHLRETAADRSREAQERQAQYYNAKRREVTFSLGDLVARRNRVLSSAVQGVSAKLAPKFSGPYEIIGRPGNNIYRLRSADGSVEDAVHVSHLKPYVVDGDGEATDGEEASRPPRDVEPPATSDPPDASENVQAEAPARADEAPSVRASAGVSAETTATAKRKPGRPRKNMRVVVRAITAKVIRPTPAAQVSARPRGRPKGSGNKNAPQPPPIVSPRQTRAQRRQLP